MRIPNRFLLRISPYLGFKTDRKIVVFESDDWGAIRMSSKDNLNRLAKNGFNVYSNSYESNDCLESSHDLSELAAVLSSYKGNNDTMPVFTLNYAMANPEFTKIKASEYTTYHFEPFTTTFRHYYGENYPLHLISQKGSLLFPQFHCREHLNVTKWMKALRDNEYNMRWIMDCGCVGTHINQVGGNPYVMAYNYSTQEELSTVKESIVEGLSMFQKIFGFYSRTAIAPNYLWGKELLDIFKCNNIECLQGGHFQIKPSISSGRVMHWMGQKSKGLYFSIRNCTFEPTQMKNNAVDRCIHDIATAFRHRQPAVVCSHRINYVSHINPQNPKIGLSQLNLLLHQILQRWPDIEFMTSDGLLDLFSSHAKNTDL